MKIKAGIIGATGYAGAELVRILIQHPQAELRAVGSVSFEGKSIAEIYPNLRGLFENILVNEEEVIDESDIIFTSVPSGLSEAYAVKCLGKGKKIIDLGADFRLEKPQDYEKWYKGSYKEQGMHEHAVYGLPELFRSEIRKAEIVGNPGCYPTSVALGLMPALKEGIISAKGIIIDSKSGITGSGRELTRNTHYAECNEGFSPYKLAEHRHIPEIEQTLCKITGNLERVTFVPHLLPINRGILSTIYADLIEDISWERIVGIYRKTYEKEAFIRICNNGSAANLKNVRMSNFCDISLHMDQRNGKLIVVSAIDNMVKGAAGQAVQNMNILFDLPEITGLDFIPPAF